MKNKKKKCQDLLEESSPSYMDLRMHRDGENHTLQLKVPTFWDEVHKCWIGAIKTPLSHTLIHVEGKDSLDLQNEFSKKLHQILSDGNSLSDEVFSMFKEMK